MTDLELLNFCKRSLGFLPENTAFDDQIRILTEAAKRDISASCDAEFDPENQEECAAAALYVRANFPINPDEKAWTLYQQQLRALGIRKGEADG